MRKSVFYEIRRLEIIIKDSIDAITVQDLQGNILAWNKGAEQIYGYSESEALTMNIMQIVPQDKKEETRLYLQKIISGEIVKSFETQRISKNGKILDVWLVVTCLKDDSGKIDSIATTERNITHIKNELREKENELKKLRNIIPICMHCKNIRNNEGSWYQIESYISKISKIDFSHGICPNCMKKYYPDFCDE